MGSQRDGHNWSDLAHTHPCVYIHDTPPHGYSLYNHLPDVGITLTSSFFPTEAGTPSPSPHSRSEPAQVLKPVGGCE